MAQTVPGRAKGYSDSERENDPENGAHGVHIFGEVSETENVTRRSDFIIPP